MKKPELTRGHEGDGDAPAEEICKDRSVEHSANPNRGKKEPELTRRHEDDGDEPAEEICKDRSVEHRANPNRGK